MTDRRRTFAYFAALVACVLVGAGITTCASDERLGSAAGGSSLSAPPAVGIDDAVLVRRARRCTRRHPCRRHRSSRSAPRAARHHEDIFDDLAHCESGHRWDANTGNGFYGGLQFSLSTWHSVGGTGYPHQHSREEQIRRGQILQQRSGWGSWPSCSRRLGLR